VSSVTKVTLVKWLYLCAVRHRQRLLLSVELSLQIAVQQFNKKLHEFPSGWSRIIEDGQNDRHEEANSLHTQFAHASCTVRAYNPRLATTFLTSIHTYMHTKGMRSVDKGTNHQTILPRYCRKVKHETKFDPQFHSYGNWTRQHKFIFISL
jgi:hypothetical protein